MAIEVTVALPLHLTHIGTATVSAGDAAQKREAEKVRLYEVQCSSRSWSFTAFLGETTRSWGQAAQRAVRALVCAKSLTTGDDPHEVTCAVWGSLGWAVVSSVARQLVRARVDCGAVAQITEAARGPSSRCRGQVHASSRGGLAGPLDSCVPAGGDLLLAAELCQ